MVGQRRNSSLGLKNSHCTYCGQGFESDQSWPRHCSSCQQISYLNPLPVAVLLLPVDDGILTIRREVGPGRGKLALPGGFIDQGESWQQACARELWEEAGVHVMADQIKLLAVHSAPDDSILIFGLAPRMASSDLEAFTATNETSQRLIISEPVVLAFSLHTQVLKAYFGQC